MFEGTRLSKDSSFLSKGSLFSYAGISLLFDKGKKLNNLLVCCNASISLIKDKSATPDFEVWVFAPPKSSAVIFSCVTVFTTSGPVTNMYELSSTIKVKSVIDGEYTAPPAQGPIIIEI